MKRLLRLARNPVVILGLAWMALLLVAAVAPSFLWQADPFAMNMGDRLAPPSWAHPFGTDEYGRDLLARVLLGTRYSLGTAVGMVFVALVVGMTIGTISAWVGGVLDLIVMRVVELFMSFPVMILAIAIVSALGASLFNAALAILVIWWGQYARLMRSEVMKAREEMYVEGARALGSGSGRILLRHIVPNSFYTVTVKATLDVGVAILLIGGMSFIGLAAQPPLPEWGLMVSAGRQFLLSYWWYPVLPGAVMFVTVIGINVLSDTVLTELDPSHSK